MKKIVEQTLNALPNFEDISHYKRKWHLMIKVIPILILIIGLKIILHKYGFEILTLN